MFGAQACKTVLHFFVGFAHLELHREQPQKIRCFITVIEDCLLYRLLKRLEQVVGGKKTGAEVCLNLESILPVHSLDPALYFNDVPMREESHFASIDGRNANRTGFALCNVAYPFEVGEVFWISKNDPNVMRVWGDSGMRRVNRGNTITCLEFAFALDALRNPTIVTFLLEARRCTQVEYNDYCSLLSAKKSW